ncbi:MAG TPA: hypothetical protein VE174_13100 [Actinomycetota bacterium]|nr:hypothetical protein [Actinomycetota bacterium]
MTTSGSFVNSNNTRNSRDLAAEGRITVVGSSVWVAAEGVLRTLKPWFDGASTTVEVDSIELTFVGDSEAVLVKLVYGQGDSPVDLVGAALIEKKDPHRAVSRAVLNALNRKLSLISAEIALDPDEG